MALKKEANEQKQWELEETNTKVLKENNCNLDIYINDFIKRFSRNQKTKKVTANRPAVKAILKGHRSWERRKIIPNGDMKI